MICLPLRFAGQGRWAVPWKCPFPITLYQGVWRESLPNRLVTSAGWGKFIHFGLGLVQPTSHVRLFSSEWRNHEQPGCCLIFYLPVQWKKTNELWLWKRQLNTEMNSLLGANLPASLTGLHKSLEAQAPNTYCSVIVTWSYLLESLAFRTIFTPMSLFLIFFKRTVLKIPIVNLPTLKEARNHLLKYVTFCKEKFKENHKSTWKSGNWVGKSHPDSKRWAPGTLEGKIISFSCLSLAPLCLLVSMESSVLVLLFS